MLTNYNPPVFDARRFREGSLADRAAMGREIVSALETVALVGFDNHPACDTARTLLDCVEPLFALPPAMRDRYILPGRMNFRGLSLGEKGQFMWHLGPEVGPGHPLEGRIPPNVWPDAHVPGFRTAMLDVFEKGLDMGRLFLEAVVLGLGGDPAPLLAALEYNTAIFRIIRYPGANERLFPTGDLRLREHVDVSLCAVQLPPSTEGLEVRATDGAWYAVPFAPRRVFIYAGQMTERLSNGRLPAVPHRVRVGRPDDPPRLSFPLFVHPHPDFVLRPLVGNVPPDELQPTSEKFMFDYFKRYVGDELDSPWAREVVRDGRL